MNKRGIKFMGGPIVGADDGCEESPQCVTCPLPVCKFDDPVWYQGLLRRRSIALAAKQIAEHEASGTPRSKAIRAVGVESGISERQVWRLLRENRGGGKP